MHFLVLLSALVACAAGVPFKTAKPTLDGRIVGGYPTTIENHPHEVALLFYGYFLCGGSIISPTCVVTTASCLGQVNANDLKIRAGSTYIDFGGTIHNVTGGFYHGNFDYYNYDYDVAVLRVDPPFTYSDSVNYINLQESEISPGTSVVVTGWGYNGEFYSDNLLEAIVYITGYDTCNAAHSGLITNRMVCTATPFGDTGPCYGDGGGSLTTRYFPRNLVGIVSMGWYCGHPDYPAVYTKVSAVHDWIINFCSAQIIPKGIIKADAMI